MVDEYAGGRTVATVGSGSDSSMVDEYAGLDI